MKNRAALLLAMFAVMASFAVRGDAGPVTYPPPAAPAVPVSPGSLIDDRPERVSYTLLAPLLASSVPVMQFQGTAADGRPYAWFNYDRQAIPGAWRGRPFTVPAGVTGVRLRLASLKRHSSVGATGPVLIQVYDALGLTQVSSTSCTVAATAADCTSGTITVTPGAEYQARISFAPAGVQSSFLATRFAVEPVTSSDPFWLYFDRLDAEGHIWGVSSLPGTWGNPRRPDALAFAEMRLRVSASIRIETWENVADYVGATRAKIRVGVAGAGDQILAPANQRAVNYMSASVSGPLPATVTITSGIQANSGYGAPAAENRGVYLAAVYKPRGAYLEVIDPPRPWISAVTDSKGVAYAAVPPQASLPAYLRARGYEVDWQGSGGRTLSQDVTASSIAAAWPLATQLCAHNPLMVIVQSQRNDLTGGVPSGTIVAKLGYAADALHQACPRAKVIVPQIARENPSWDVADWDTHRTATAALSTDTSAVDSLARAHWLTVAPWDALYTRAEAAAIGSANSRSADGAHPADAGFERMDREMSGVEPFPIPTVLLSSAALWVEADHGLSGGSAGSVTAGGSSPPSVTLTGTPADARRIAVEVATVNGAAGTFRWSADGGKSWPSVSTAFATTGQTIALGSTGLSVVFPSGSYNNLHSWRWDTAPTTWADLSANGRNLTTYSGNTATWTAAHASYANKPTVTTASAGYFGRAGLSIAPPYAIVFVGAIDAQTALKVFYGRQSGGTGVMLYVTSGSAIALNDGSSQIVTSTFSTATSPHCIVADYEPPGTNSVIYIDGVSYSSGDLPGNATLTSTWIGTDEPAGLGGVPTVAQYAIIPGQITTDQVTGICRRASHKWGTP